MISATSHSTPGYVPTSHGWFVQYIQFVKVLPNLVLLHQGGVHLPCSRLLASLTTKDWDKDGIQYLRHSRAVHHQLLFTSGCMFSSAAVLKVIPYQALALLTLSLQNWAVFLCSSWSPNRLKPALLRPRDVILLFASIPLESWALLSHGHCSYNSKLSHPLPTLPLWIGGPARSLLSPDSQPFMWRNCHQYTLKNFSLNS